MDKPVPFTTDREELWRYVEWLESEVDRMSSGRLTEQELQNLCHEQGTDCPRRFAEGCVEYNRELFGDCTELKLKSDPCVHQLAADWANQALKEEP